VVLVEAQEPALTGRDSFGRTGGEEADETEMDGIDHHDLRPLPDSYGDVTGEYLAVRHETALVRGQHALVWVRGADAVDFLQDLVSQEVRSLSSGNVARSFLLSPQGRLRALLWLLRGDDEVGLIADAHSGEEVVASDLERFRIRVDAEIEAEPRPVLELWGPRSGQVLTSAGLPTPEGWDRRESFVVASLPLVGLRRYLVVGADPDLLIEHGARPVGRLAATAVRVEGGEPLMGQDLDEKTIPQESGLVAHAVSFEKGCYLGQELVARIDSRGHVNRMLRGVIIETNVLPPEGSEIRAGDRVVGRVTSVAESLTLRAPIALALVRREVAPGEDVTVGLEGGSVPAHIEDLPLDDFTDS
jgi:folate-binding protein YgfZ